MSDTSSQAFVDRLKADSGFAQEVSEFLKQFAADEDSLHEYLASCAYEQGYEYDIEALKRLMEGVDIQELMSVKRRLKPQGPLSKVADPGEIEGARGKPTDSGVFDKKYKRIGQRKSRHD